ncbi:MAG: polysaccharide deacetylase family protein [Clostridia bacterium]|nr:polysaccharide deacetylase family protein [Clostridia bacterium]
MTAKKGRFLATLLCLCLLLSTLPILPVRAEKSTDAPRVALTFDDGPHPGRTKRILALLDRYSVKATFFILGCNAEYYPEPLALAVAAGHEIEDHSFDHVTRGKTALELENSITKTARIIEQASGRSPRFFRPPEGKCTPELNEALSVLGYESVFWTVDSRDWTGKPAEAIARDVLAQVKDGDVLLFHDYTCPGENTLHALEKIIPALLSRGYRFVTVEEMFACAK